MSEQSENKINSYLSFRLADEAFAIHVNRVHKIMEVSEITEVPKSPDYMKGVINLRGEVLPVIDTRRKFGMPEAEQTKSTSIIVIDVQIEKKTVKVGLLVDGVKAVEMLEEKDLLPPPGLGDRYKSQFISYMARVKDKFIIILNMEAVFSADEQIDIREIAKARDSLEKSGKVMGNKKS